MKRWLLSLVSVMAIGCATTGTGNRIIANRSDMSTFTGSVRVIVWENGNGMPWCGLPDASNEITCYFYWEWMSRGGLVGVGLDGWRFITYPDAMSVCSYAMRGSHYEASDVQTCANLLLQVRYMELLPDPEEDM